MSLVSMTNILVNGLVLNDRFTGVQYYVENLLHAMNGISGNSININLLIAAGYKGKLQSASGINVLPTKIDSRNRINRIYFENFKLTGFVKSKPFNVYHSPNYLLPFSPPLPSILTVHDLIAVDYPGYAKNETVLYHKILQR